MKQVMNLIRNKHEGSLASRAREDGKIKKQYNDYLTPFEKLQTLTDPK
jgi:hypothetical protein